MIIRYQLSAPAQVVLRLFDGRDLQIREISSKTSLPQGEHSIEWDLRDNEGRAVPPESYTYVLEAHGADGQTMRYDLADLTGGEPVTARDVKWDVKTGRLAVIPIEVRLQLLLRQFIRAAIPELRHPPYRAGIHFDRLIRFALAFQCANMLSTCRRKYGNVY